LNSKTLFVCRRAKSVLNLAEQASAETCSRAEPVARPTEKLPRGLDLSAGDHFPALRGFGALSFRRSAASSPRSINRRIASGPDGFGSGAGSGSDMGAEPDEKSSEEEPNAVGALVKAARGEDITLAEKHQS
jgi:hypothetical protein